VDKNTRPTQPKGHFGSGGVTTRSMVKLDEGEDRSGRGFEGGDVPGGKETPEETHFSWSRNKKKEKIKSH